MAVVAQRQWARADVLRWAILGTVVFGVGMTMLSALEVQRARHDVHVLSRSATRSTAVVGEVGRHIMQLRLEALGAILVPAPDGVDVVRAISAIGALLDARLEELATLLQPRERVRWTDFQKLLTSFRRRIDEAIAVAATGYEETARAIMLREIEPLAVGLQDELVRLIEMNEEETRRLLETADLRLARARELGIVLDLGLVGAVAMMWWAAVRALQRQGTQLSAYLQRVERSNEDLDSFAGRVAHDLGNTLAPMTLIAAALRRAHAQPETVDRLAKQLWEAAQRQQTLIRALLAFSRPAPLPEAGAVASVRAVVADVVEDLAALAAQMRAQLCTEVEDVVVRCPSDLLRVVGANLIGNALKYLEGCPVRRVLVRAQRIGDGWVELSVEDTGPGVPAEAQPHLFEPFYRVPGTRAAGTGIGLATVRRIVERCGGTITLISTVGVGSAFHVRLPGVRAATAETSEAPRLQ